MRVRNEKAPGRYADGNGLYLHVADTGARWWIWRGTVHGKRTELGIGGTSLYTLAEAREIAREWRKIARAGGDPKAERDKGKQQSLTFKEAAEKVHREQIVPHSRSKRHRDQWINSLRDYVFPLIGSRAVHSIAQSDVLRVLAPIWSEKPETAKRVKQRLSSVLDWARTAGYREGVNPVEGVEKGLPKQRHKPQHLAALPYDQLPDFMRRLEAEESVVARAVQFAILTGARSGEVRHATWSEFDLEAKVWTIPAERMKMGREHRVPLSDEALGVLEKVKGLSADLVFPSARPGRPMADSTPAEVFKALDAQVTLHGFRSSLRDWSEECTAFPHEVKEAALAHVVRSQVERAYRRTDLFEKRRELMAAWGRYCASATRKGEVVRLPA